MARGGRRRRGRAGSLSPRHVPGAHPGQRPGGVRPARPQPRAHGEDWGSPRRVRSRLRTTLRAQPGRRTALRDNRGLSQFRKARVPVPGAAPLRRHPVRTGRPAGEQTPSRHGLQPPALQRQTAHGLGDRTRTRRGQRGHDEARVRRHLRRAQHGAREPDQRELANGLGRHHARRAQGVCAPQPGNGGLPVHSRGRHVPGDGGRHLCTALRRGARRAWPSPRSCVPGHR